jgi:two-component system, NtrC family, sensor kinase
VPERGNALDRMLQSKRVVHVVDDAAEQVPSPAGSLGGARSLIAVPMLKENELVGAIFVYRQEVRPFTDKQIDLVTNFARQAVIAIENTRLLNELRESLQQQTATADVLKVISRSAFNLERVLSTLAESAARLCEAASAVIFRPKGAFYSHAASYGLAPDFKEFVEQIELNPSGRSVVGRALSSGSIVHVPDVTLDAEYFELDPERFGGYHAFLGVPLLREGKPIGVIMVGDRAAREYTQKQIALVSTFADQAVIAIENSRLFEEVQSRTRELTDALEQQTATSEVLSVISSSPTDTQPVFSAIAKNAVRLCNAMFGAVFSYDGRLVHFVAGHQVTEDALRLWRDEYPIPPRGLIHRAITDRAVVNVANMFEDLRVANVEVARTLGNRSQLVVPMLQGDQVIGTINVYSAEPVSFTDAQIALLETFADQAVIAIENTRLFEEVQARTRELAKTVEDLEIASQHKNQFVANMSHELRTPLAAILGYAELIQEGFYEPQGPKSLDALTRIRSNGKHLLGLINTVLDIAKIESGQFALNMT